MSTSDGLTDFSGVGDGADRHMVQKRTIASMVLTGDLILTTLFRNRLRIDPDGARNIDLPLIVDNDGAWFEIANFADGAETITVRKGVTDGAGTVLAVLQNRKATFYCDGADWIHTGLVTIAIA